MIIPVPSAKIDEIWPIIAPHIEVATDKTHGTIAPDDIKALCRQTILQMFVILNEDEFVGAVTAELVNYPQKRILRILTVGGNGWEAWGCELSDTLDQLAQIIEADGIEVVGRKGWVKKLQTLGYEQGPTIYRKRLR